MFLSERVRTFLVFAEVLNLSETARRLRLSQPAVHTQLRLLGEELGFPLYQREGRALALTLEGKRVAAHARAMAEQERGVLSILRGEKDESPLVLAAGAGALVHLLAHGLRAFTQRKDAPRVHIVTASATEAVELVEQGRAHIGVGVLEMPPERLPARVLHQAEQVAVLPARHPLARRRSLCLADLEGTRLILPPEGGEQRRTLEAALSRGRVQIERVASARGWDVVIRLVEVGVGIGVVNSICRLPRALVARRIRDLPKVTYMAFTRERPRPAANELVRAFGGG